MNKDNKIVTIFLIILILAFGALVVLKLSKNNEPKKVEYDYYSYYSENFETDILDGKEYKIIENYDEYKTFISLIENIQINGTLKEYDEKYFKNNNLIIVNAYEIGACSESSYKIKIEVENNKLDYEAEYSLGGVCGGGIGYLTFIETDKKINEVEVCIDNMYQDSNPDVEKKPVLYLYPEKDMNVTVTFENSNTLTTTYPKYNNGWNVFVTKDGTINLNNKKYYALYWENTTNKEVDFSTGFYVTKENAITFLEEKLSIIGLNYKEQNEFIMYWLPILEQNEKSLIYFELTEEKQADNKLIINPTPDSLLRVTMHVKKINEYVEIEKQNIPTFERKGFVAVEWGGVEH